jgi:hypothetical protein
LHGRRSPTAGTGVKVIAAVAEALAKNGAPAGYRTNPKGEHVVAIIWPPESP